MTKYIVLLRGINISGKNKISMKELKMILDNYYENVSTYLNSGNIILESNANMDDVKNNIGNIIKDNYNLEIPIYITTKDKLKELIDNHPKWWGLNNKEVYDNIIFIIPPTTYNEVYNSLGTPKDDIEKIEEYNNSIFWSYNLKQYQKTNWWSKTANSSISNKITIRTARTIQKLLEK